MNTQQAPKVGDAATYSIGTDHYPCTVTYVSPSAAKIVVTFDRKRGAGIYTEGDTTETAWRDARGRYKCRSALVTIGERIHRLDPNF